MSFQLNSIITIGAFKFRGVNSVKIVKSIHSFIDTCNIVIPTVLRMPQTATPVTESVFVTPSDVFLVGDKVTVQLGYDGSYNTEFIGFVRRVDLATPCVVECEGYINQLRNPLPAKTFVGTNLKTLLQYIVQDTNIVLSKAIPDMKIERKVINTITGAEVLEQLKKDFFLTIFFHDNELYAGLKYTQYNGIVKHQIGWNVIKDNELKRRLGNDIKVRIVYTGVKKDGTKITVNGGDNSSNIEKRRTHAVTDEATLQAMADAMADGIKYDGYEGNISTFGIPFCQHGWVTQLTDPRYQERSGNYIIDHMEVLYSLQGFRRRVGIGIKVS